MANPEIYTGENVNISFGWEGHADAALTEWESYELTLSTVDRELNRAKAGTDEFASIRRNAELTVRGFRGGSESFMDLVKAGATLTGISGDDLPTTNQQWADELGIPLIQYAPSRWSCTSKKVSQSADPGTWELTFKYGRRKTTVPAP